MRTPTLSTVLYAPEPVPSDLASLVLSIQQDRQKVAAAINALAAGHIDMVYAVPLKPREGDIRLADGTTWNPGSGKGVYCYYGAAWHLLG